MVIRPIRVDADYQAALAEIAPDFPHCSICRKVIVWMCSPRSRPNHLCSGLSCFAGGLSVDAPVSSSPMDRPSASGLLALIALLAV